MNIVALLKNLFNKNHKNYKWNLALLLFSLIFLLFSTIEIASIFFGGACVFAGFYMRSYTKNIEKNGFKAKAKIVDFEIIKRRENKRGTLDSEIVSYYFPIVSFKDLNGNEITHKVDSSTNFKEINTILDVIYLKSENGYQIIIDSNWRKSYFFIIIIIIGFNFFLSGLLSLLIL